MRSADADVNNSFNTALSISTALVIEQLLHPSLKFAMSAP